VDRVRFVVRLLRCTGPNMDACGVMSYRVTVSFCGEPVHEEGEDAEEVVDGREGTSSESDRLRFKSMTALWLLTVKNRRRRVAYGMDARRVWTGRCTSRINGICSVRWISRTLLCRPNSMHRRGNLDNVVVRRTG
jgi:hypothetical protein